MAIGLTPAVADRRSAARVPAAVSGWADRAVLRPGQELTLLNIAAGGVLVSADAALRPGRRVDVQLDRQGGKMTMTGRVVRCRFVSLRPPMYQAAIAFERALVAEGAGNG